MRRRVPPGLRDKIHIAVDGFSGTPRYHVEIVDPDHGSALAAWKAMGSPASPTREQYEQLRRAAAGTQKLDGTSSFMLPSQGLALVEVRPH